MRVATFLYDPSSDLNSPSNLSLLPLQLLRKNKTERLGSVESGGAGAVMAHGFFSEINFKQLYDREVVPPFVPELKNDFDLRYIPRTIKEQTTGESFSEEKRGIRPGTKTNINFENFSYSEDT